MWATRTSRRPRQEGYTLTELAVVMSVFMIFMAFAAPFMFSQLRSALRTEDETELQQSGRAAFRTMVRELRQAQVLYSTSDRPSARDRVSFGVDLNGSGGIGTDEVVVYYLRGGALYRGPRINEGAPLAENVTGLEFTFYGSNPALDTDNDGVVEQSELNPPDGMGTWTDAELRNVTRIVVEVTLDEGDASHAYRAEAWLRNRVVG